MNRSETIKAFHNLCAAEKEYLKLMQNQLTEHDWYFKPDEESWSLLEVMEHLYIAENAAYQYIIKKVKSPNKPIGLKEKTKLFLLQIALHLPFKYKVPKVVQKPGNYTSVFVLIDDWKLLHLNFEQMLENLEEAKFNEQLFKHPIAGKLNLYQCFSFLHTHLGHHKKQINRILQQLQRKPIS